MKRFLAGRRGSLLGGFVAAIAAIGLFAPSAGAVLIHVGHGQVAGVTPVRHVNPASIPGSFARHRAGASNTSPVGILNYHGGAVMHGSAPYLIFWDPSNKIPAAEKALYERYLADSAADSGKATNVYSVDRQFTDTTGFADYHQVFAASHAITDAHAYPAKAQQCTENAGFTESACLFDGQLQTEVQRLITNQGLPTGVTGDAPLYFVITPPDVNSCFDAPSDTVCADNFFCAYHSSFTGSGGSTVLYSNLATVLAANDPKSCQFDNHPAVQAPNSLPVADVTLKAFSHEFNETITDPVNGGGWWDSGSGQENGDQCNFFNPTSDPAGGGNPNAFTPTLGGSASAGTLFNQSINANPYYLQSEWSNAGANCRMNPTPSALGAAFTAPAASVAGAALGFDPSASAAAGGFSSTTWSFGDGSAQLFARTAPATVSHTYAANGTYTVTLTEVDKFGNLSTVSHTVTVHNAPTSAFTASSNTSPAGASVSFNGSGSNEPGGSISSYSWSFGDGSTGAGATTSHAYSTAGTYTVTLTVADSFGSTASSTQQVKVVGVPSAAIGVTSGHPVAGVPFTFDGSPSHDTGSTLASYSWNFGDGGTATGASPGHTFGKTGTFSVSLTVTDASGAASTITKPITVQAPSITKVKVKKGKKAEQLKVTLSGPGVLRLGSKKSTVGGPGTVTVKVKLSKSQLKTLHRKGKLTVKYKLKFQPISGQAGHKTVTLKLKL